MQLLDLEKRSFDILKLWPQHSWLHERRHDREAEGAPLLREYVPKAHRGFESHCLRHSYKKFYNEFNKLGFKKVTNEFAARKKL